MIRIKDGHIEIKEEILTTLNVKNGDFFEQKSLKDGSIVFKKISDGQLRGMATDKVNSLTERLKRIADEKVTNELLHFLINLEKSLSEYEQVHEMKDKDNVPDFYLPLERDLDVLRAVYEGNDTLSKIAASLESPQSAVSDSLNMLYSNDFVDYNRSNDGKRGRPKHIYFLTWHGEQFCSMEFE